MAAVPPPGFVDLTTAYSQKDKALNVMGVVVDHLPAAKSNGTDYVITFTIYDSGWVSGSGLKFRFFNKSVEKLPAIETNGDVVLLRNVKVKSFGGGWTGISNSTSTWTVFPESSLPASQEEQLSSEALRIKQSSSVASPTRLETEYAILLCNSKRGSSLVRLPATNSLPVATTTVAGGGGPLGRRERFSLIQDLSLPENGARLVFADLLGEVRKYYENDYCVELSITDYTTNGALYNYSYGCGEDGPEGDEFGYTAQKHRTWPGPWGKMTMNVRMWDSHANFARDEVKLGHFVFLRNVHISTGHDGKHYLEGKLRGDHNDPSRVGIKVYKARHAAKDVRLKDLLVRKREYEAKALSEHKDFVRDASMVPKKRLASESERPDLGSRKKVKHERNKKKNAVTGSDQVGRFAGTEVKKVESNSHVRCQKTDVPLKSITEIMDREILRRTTPSGNDFYLPFQNCCYHSKVRVVDFLPGALADFACPYRPSDYDVLSDHEDCQDSDTDLDGNGDVKWEWRFYLLVEDATAPASLGAPRMQLPLLVADKDAEYLLDMEASDLRNDAQKLAQTREKLFVLWGDLQEQKEARGDGDVTTGINPSAKPFECFIKEYGIPARDEHGCLKDNLEFHRMFRIWGTTVK